MDTLKSQENETDSKEVPLDGDEGANATEPSDEALAAEPTNTGRRVTSVKIEVFCLGITPIMFDPMPEQVVQDTLIDGRRDPPIKDISKWKRAGGKFYEDPEGLGRIGMPTENLHACLREAGRKVKYDARSNITTGEGSVLPEFLTIEDTWIALTDLDSKHKDENGKMQPWKPDVRRGQMKQGGKKTACGVTRPKVENWGFNFRVIMDLNTPVTPATVKRLVVGAGKRVGLCSFRPACKGTFGQFRVISMKIVDRFYDVDESDDDLIVDIKQAA